MTNFPKLPVLQISEPCHKDWDKMSGDAQQRFCDHCEKHVHNFSEMSAIDVREIIESGESVCARIQTRSDGSIVTREKARRSFFSQVRGLAAFAAVFAIAGCSKEPESSPPVTGAICAPGETIDSTNVIERPPIVEMMGEVCEETSVDAGPDASDGVGSIRMGKFALPISNEE